MEISSINNSYNNFGTQKLFNTTVFKKAADGVKKPVKAFISELSQEDVSRKDLLSEAWKPTKYGLDILKDFTDKYTGSNSVDKAVGNTVKNTRIFAVEVPVGARESQIIALGEAKVRDEFIVLDRLQALQGKDEVGRLTGGGSNILYIISDIAKKMKKLFVSLEADEEAIDFYKRSGMLYEPRGDFSFFRVYQPNYSEFMKSLEKKFGITPFEK